MGKKSNNGYTVADMDTKYAPTSWGRKNPANEPFEYETSSGQTCLIRKLGITDILKLKLVDQLDFFTKSLSEDDKAKPEAPKNNADFTKALMDNFDKMDETINKILVVGVIAPVVHPIPENEALRSEDKVYADEIPFEDRIELFTQILDTEGLSDFREEPANGVGHVPDVESVSAGTE